MLMNINDNEVSCKVRMEYITVLMHCSNDALKHLYHEKVEVVNVDDDKVWNVSDENTDIRKANINNEVLERQSAYVVHNISPPLKSDTLKHTDDRKAKVGNMMTNFVI